VGWLALAAALAGRVGLALAVDRALGRGVRPGHLMLLPLRDLLSFAIWAAGLARGTVVWQGRRYRMRRDGTMIEAATGRP
jgi:ceramide glucosyltransferase